MPKHICPNPTVNKPGVACRLFGRDFPSMAHAARYYDISHAWVREIVARGDHKETDREAIRKKWKKNAKVQD